MASADAIIIGAGIHGCSTALHLARAGIKVLVLEQAHPGRHASGVNAGGVRRLGRHFAEIPLSLRSMQLWQDIESLVDDDCGFQRSGQVKVAETERELEKLKQRVIDLKQRGYNHEKVVSCEELKELLPHASSHCRGAIYCAGDGHAKPFRTVRAFYHAAERGGAQFHLNEVVKVINRESGVWKIKTAKEDYQAPILINAAGAWGGKIAEKIGDRVPIEAEALMLMISERMEPFCKPVVGAAGRTLSFKQFVNGTVLIGGGLKGYVKEHRADINIKQLSINAETARSIFPIMDKVRITRCWAGIEGFVSDGLPVISKSNNEDAIHLFGFSAHGFQLGPVTGEIVRDLVLAGESKLPIDAFSVNRFN